MIIKVLLIGGVVAFSFIVLRNPNLGRHLAIRRVFGGLVALGGILAVLFPLAVTDVANAVGVGRGTDLVLYVLVMVFLFTSLSLYQHIYELEAKLTALTRELALQARESDPEEVPRQDRG
jgi:hypothetical protein